VHTGRKSRHLAPGTVLTSTRLSRILADSLFPFLQRHQRPGQAGLGSIQEQPHAQSLAPLHGYQTHMPADVVAIFQQRYLRLVEGGILFQPLNPLFYGVAKPGTNLKTLAGSAIYHHGRLLKRKSMCPQRYCLRRLMFSQSVPILMLNIVMRQITAGRYEGN
jgi:hypothetical protein